MDENSSRSKAADGQTESDSPVPLPTDVDQPDQAATEYGCRRAQLISKTDSIRKQASRLDGRRETGVGVDVASVVQPGSLL